MLVSTTIEPRAEQPDAAMTIAIGLLPIAMLRRDRDARRSEALRFLCDQAALDEIIPGLSDLDPGPANDLLREFRNDPFRQLRVPPETLQGALLAARTLCWLRLHRPHALALLNWLCANRPQLVGGPR
ncbi:hypothetical protein MFUR16E_04495 [Methylobacterium fujisawaense]|uniref:hypothetical protein n=1 Tax=Methylobacterium fujisawaense TaxID=107400 RepID=UPI002F332634